MREKERMNEQRESKRKTEKEGEKERERARDKERDITRGWDPAHCSLALLSLFQPPEHMQGIRKQ